MTTLAANPATDTRLIIRQGGLISVCGKVRGTRSGGGLRGMQRGHSRRAALRMHKHLLGSHPADRVIWLTFPWVQGPQGVHEFVKKFLVKMQKHLGHPVGAVTKLEIQRRRLSAELCVMVWGAGAAELEQALLADLWAAVIGAVGRVDVQPVNDWYDLASYQSKTIIVTPEAVTIGCEIHPLSLRHNTRPDPSPRRGRRPRATGIRPANGGVAPFPPHTPESVLHEWVQYNGHFCWKHNPSEIPQHECVVAKITNETAEELRVAVNQVRTFFKAADGDGFHMRGRLAERALAALPSDLRWRDPHSDPDPSDPSPPPMPPEDMDALIARYYPSTPQASVVVAVGAVVSQTPSAPPVSTLIVERVVNDAAVPLVPASTPPTPSVGVCVSQEPTPPSTASVGRCVSLGDGSYAPAPPTPPVEIDTSPVGVSPTMTTNTTASSGGNVGALASSASSAPPGGERVVMADAARSSGPAPTPPTPPASADVPVEGVAVACDGLDGAAVARVPAGIMPGVGLVGVTVALTEPTGAACPAHPTVTATANVNDALKSIYRRDKLSVSPGIGAL